MDFRESIIRYAGQPITKQILLDILKDFKRPFDKIDELVKQGFLLQVKRGLYIPGIKLKMSMPESFLLANHLHGPSYVSLDAALSYWGLIPEKVYEISSITTATSKIYRTPVGRFSFKRMRLPFYSFGIKQIVLGENQTALIATPEKALCDKIITTKSMILRSSKQTIELLLEDLRMEKDALRDIDSNEIKKWVNDAPKKESLMMLIKTLEKI